MEPGTIDAAQWGQISRALIYLFLFTGLGLTSAMAFLFGGAIVPKGRRQGCGCAVARWLRAAVGP